MIAAAFLSSAMSVDNTPEVGKNAPKIETIQGTNVGYDANSEKTKVISFWSPKKPMSRINNRNLYRQYADNNRDNVEFISICTDSDVNLMKEVLKIDGVNENLNYEYSEISSRAFKDYGVENNPKAFVISSEGKILEII